MKNRNAWKPIEMAPKDGTQIIVPVSGFIDVVAWWAGGWREGTNGLRLREEPRWFIDAPALPEHDIYAADPARIGADQ